MSGNGNGQGNNGNGGSNPPGHSDDCSHGCCEVQLIVGVLKATRPRFAVIPSGSNVGIVVQDPSTKVLRDKAIAAALDRLP